ncbi:hypothetical protein LR48_Vigan07g072300 [Vigna angularis]|uniref:Uncharacterized protein n=1 Tax=Phaseolus angularis TaxID=3914 RepID=A0A0L9UWW1_PHAAN|nr:hypothetical protein LR48_Vigan07g072300 [Vigna angularis]
MSEVVTTTGKLFQFNTSENNPNVVHRKSENREPYSVFIEQPICFFISPKDKISLQSFHHRQKAPRKKEPSFHNLAPNHFNSSTEPHSVPYRGESPKTNQELQQKKKLQDQTKKSKANTKNTSPLHNFKLLSIQIKSSQTPPHASIRKQRREAMEEEWRREEGLAVVDEKNISDQQQQQHQWRMNISNTSDEDDDGNGALGSGDGGEARTSGDDEEQSKPRRPEVEPATVMGHLAVGTETTGAVVQWCGGEARAVVNGEAKRFCAETWEEE